MGSTKAQTEIDVCLANISIPQVVKCLDTLQLTVPDEREKEDLLGRLRYNKIFQQNFHNYKDEEIVAVFAIGKRGKIGKFLDFKSLDNKVSSVFGKTGDKKFPCAMCSIEVKDAPEDGGIECGACGRYFHNRCSETPLTINQMKELKNSPPHVRIFCEHCDRAYESIRDKLAHIENQVAECNTNVTECKDKLSKTDSYSSKVTQGMRKNNSEITSIPKVVVNSLAEMTREKRDNDNEAKLKRSRIVLKPMDAKIRNSPDIRREFNKHHQGVIIEHCRITAGGSVLFEFQDSKTAEEVEKGWSKEYFGGNVGMRTPGNTNTAGVIKHVFDDVSEDVIKEDISKQYPGSEIELFKRQSDGKFLGTIKVDFKDRQKLQDAIENTMKIQHQRYIVEEHKRKPRLVKCNRCQKFGHIQRYCYAKEPKCGKCSKSDHETKDCTITSGFKCAHCNGNHETASKQCKVWNEKLAEYTQVINHGF